MSRSDKVRKGCFSHLVVLYVIRGLFKFKFILHKTVERNNALFFETANFLLQFLQICTLSLRLFLLGGFLSWLRPSFPRSLFNGQPNNARPQAAKLTGHWYLKNRPPSLPYPALPSLNAFWRPTNLTHSGIHFDSVKYSARLQPYPVSGIVNNHLATVTSVYLYPHATNSCPRAKIH